MGKIIRNGVEYGDVSASNISFTPTSGGLLSNNVQDAITELDTNKVDKENGKGLFSGSYTDLTNKPTIPTNNNQLTNGAGYITSSGSCNYATSAGTATDSTKVAKTGDTMSGRLNFSNFNTAQVNFRINHDSYDGTISYQTAGNEAMVFATKNAVTSFMFVNGEDSVANASDTRWQSLTPGLQIKNNKVAIGKLIPTGTTPSHALDVNGTALISTTSDTPFRIKRNATGNVYEAFENSSGVLGYYAVGSDKKPYFESAGSSDVRLVLQSEMDAKNFVKDVGNNVNTTFAYSKAGLGVNEYSWLAGWNGYELRAVNKNHFMYVKGDTFDAAWIILMGAINSGATVIECFLVLAKPITATGMSVTGTIEWVRGNGVAASTKSFYPSTTRIINSSAGLVQISISTSGFSGASMCAGMASITNFKITFS